MGVKGWMGVLTGVMSDIVGVAGVCFGEDAWGIVCGGGGWWWCWWVGVLSAKDAVPHDRPLRTLMRPNTWKFTSKTLRDSGFLRLG
eukprot:12934692-Prorocentrum_lima.AAC.1